MARPVHQGAGTTGASLLPAVGPLPALSRRALAGAILGLAVLAHLLLASGLPPLARGLSALLLTALLPGWLLVEWLVGTSEAPPDTWERTLYATGTGYALMVLVMLALSYLPGVLARWQTLAAFDLLLLALLLLVARRWNGQAHRSASQSSTFNPSAGSGQALQPAISNLQSPISTRSWFLVGMIALLLIGGFLRFAQLGYSEFQGDEARPVLRTAAIIQGYDDALFLHKRGPAEILIMTGVYSLTGQLTEELARLPFALANLTCLFVGFLLGWRLFGPVAGWITAILLALDGYYIGYGRIAQYSSLIFLAPALAVLILYRLARLPKALPGYLTLVAIVLAGGLLAHYEVALVIAPGAYLLWLLWQRVRERAALGRALVAPLLIGGVALASFYIPFLLDPNIANTFSHYSDGTFGGQLPHNNLRQFFLQTSMYNTTYYVVLMIALAVVALARIYLRGLGRVWGGLASLVLILGVLLSALVPGWLTLGGSDFTALFFGVALAGAWLIPGVGTEERLVWIWLGVTMLLAFFLIARPSSHLYDLAMPWALLNGMVLARGWRWLQERAGTRGAALAGVGAAALTIALFGGYAYWSFVYNVDILRNWSKPSIYWTAYERPDDLPTFGFPHKSGWKAIGALYRDGVIAGTYDTNHKGWVAEWYTRGAPQCDREFDYFFLDLMEEPEEHAEVRGELEEGGFRLAGSVGVDGQQRLEIYERTVAAPAPRDYDLAAYESRFDAQLLDPQFRLDYPTVRPRHPVGYRLGEQIWLEAYNLDRERVQPGETLELTLYWRTTGRVPERYTVFNQLIDPGVAMYGQQDREPGCDGGPTTDWHPGDLIVDRYTVPVFAEAKPGTYPLITGMYQAERGERLEVYDAAGQPLGNSIELARITVEPPQ